MSLIVTGPCAKMLAMASGPSLIFSDGLERPLRGEISIGRDPENDLVLITKSVSRRHARLTEREGRWLVEDLGSFNGTLVNDTRIPAGTQLPLRHADRLTLGSQVIVFSQPAERGDPDQTESALEVAPADVRPLSPLQLRIVRLLCEPWLAGGSLEHLPSNDELAAQLGTPGATGTVKAALRRAYAKAGVTHLPAHEKRRALCRIARQRGWI